MWDPALDIFPTLFKGWSSSLLWCRFSPAEAVLFQAKWHTAGQHSVTMPIASRAIQFRFSGLDVLNLMVSTSTKTFYKNTRNVLILMETKPRFSHKMELLSSGNLQTLS